MTLNPRDLKILAVYEFKILLRSGPGMLALLFLGMYGVWCVSKVAEYADSLNSLASGSLSQQETFVMGALKWLANLDEAFLQRLFQDHSPFLTVLFMAVAFATPLFTMVAALDQNATDISGKGIRFLLPRTTRLNLVIGRYLGTILFWSTLIVLMGVAATLTGLTLDQHHGAALVVLDGLWFTAALLLLSLPLIALMAFCGVVTGSPLLSATMGLGAYLGVWLLGGLGGWINDGLKVFRYLLPMPLRYDLMIGTPAQVALAGVAMLIYTGVFLGAAIWVAQKRDL
jgi:ABC-type transport system involved in multi-copper enzyme maturation permease subunit